MHGAMARVATSGPGVVLKRDLDDVESSERQTIGRRDVTSERSPAATSRGSASSSTTYRQAFVASLGAAGGDLVEPPQSRLYGREDAH